PHEQDGAEVNDRGGGKCGTRLGDPQRRPLGDERHEAPMGQQLRGWSTPRVHAFLLYRRVGATEAGSRVSVRYRQPLILTLLPSLDLIEFGQRSLKFLIEEPHPIENFADGCRRFCPVSLSKGEDAVVAQVSHYRGIRDFIVC